MAKLKFQGSATGTGTVTLVAPTTDSTRTITLPDGDITLGGGVDGIVSTANATAITIDASGNVGIGTSSPDAPMTIQRPSSNQGVSAGISLKGQDGTTQGGLGTDGVNDNAVQLVANEFIKFHTNNTDGTTNERMRIDSAGIVTMPNQPAFYVHSTVGNVNITNSATTVVPFSTASFNRGNHFNLSSNVFYAPVAGVYSFHYHTYEQGSNGYNRLNITLNASSVAYKITGSHGGALTTTVSALIYCNVNDAVGVTFQSDQSNDYYAAYNHSFFTGHLIG